MPVGQDYRDAFYPPQSAEAEGYLLVLEHADWDEPLRFTTIRRRGDYDEVSGTYRITVGGHVYTWAPFSITEPNIDDESPRGRISLPNVDSSIGEFIDALSTPVIATITPVLKSDPSVQLTDPFILMEVTAVNGDRMSVSGDLGWPSLSTEPFTWEWINPTEFRATFRAIS
jgi:hypothetical protein